MTANKAFDPTTGEVVNVDTGARTPSTDQWNLLDRNTRFSSPLLASLGAFTLVYVNAVTGDALPAFSEASAPAAVLADIAAGRLPAFLSAFNLAETSDASINVEVENSFVNGLLPGDVGSVLSTGEFDLVSWARPVTTLGATVNIANALNRNYAPTWFKRSVRDSVADQVLWGDGTGHNALGLNHAPGLLTGAVGNAPNQLNLNQGVDTVADPIVNVVHRAMMALFLASRRRASAIIMNAFDWDSVVSMRSGDRGASQGQYLLNDGFQDEPPLKLFGCPVFLESGTAPKTVFVVAGSGCKFWQRQKLFLNFATPGQVHGTAEFAFSTLDMGVVAKVLLQ